MFDLMVLLNVCISQNRRRDITGVLAYRNSAFLQVLEGPDVAIDALFVKICSDYRHRDVHVINREFTVLRAFADWSMAYLGYEHDLRLQFEKASTPLSLNDADQVVGSLAALLN